MTKDSVKVVKAAVDELAWKAYVNFSAGAMAAVDFWSQLGPNTQAEYRRYAIDAIMKHPDEHFWSHGMCTECLICGISYLDTLSEWELSNLHMNGCFDPR